MTTKYTVMGPAGAPMRPPFGSFAGKPTANTTRIVTVMGPAGAPMRPPYAAFTGKTAGAVSVRHNEPFLATVGMLKSF